MNSTEIEFKFKITKEQLENYLIKIFEYLKWYKKSGLNCQVNVNPCFSVYSDTYYRPTMYGMEHDNISKFDFFRKRVDKSANIKFNDDLFEAENIDFRRCVINAVEGFLNHGTDSTLFNELIRGYVVTQSSSETSARALGRVFFSS